MTPSIHRICSNFLKALLLFFFLNSNVANAQVDTEFWFVVPEITYGHTVNSNDAGGGVPAKLHIAAMSDTAIVTISMPADEFSATNTEGFSPIVQTILPNQLLSIDISSLIRENKVEVNKLENKNLTPDGINPFGLHIASTSLVTAYYEVSNMNNNDIWAFKGQNALGTDFYTPFQKHRNNGSNYTPKPYSAIDVVATVDYTEVTFELPAGKSATYGSNFTQVTAGGTHTVTLMRGETFSLMPKTVDTGNNKRISQDINDRLAGTHITSTDPIAVTLKDDSFQHRPEDGCYDVGGDQLIPTNLLGWKYIVNRTNLFSYDYIYVVATAPQTQVWVDGVLRNTINESEQIKINLPESYSLVSTQDKDHPIVVMHVGGFGCEQGIAIVPPISVCTGSTQVAFSRVQNGNPNFVLTMMVRKGAQDGFLIDGVQRNNVINPSSFVEVPGTDWMVAKFGSFNTNPVANGGIPNGAHLIENTKDLFHLGVVHGGPGSGCMYGYFSNFNEIKAAATIGGDVELTKKMCYGDLIQLYASGGSSFLWSRLNENFEEVLGPLYLDNANIAEPTIQSGLPVGIHQYQVVASGLCDMTDTAIVKVLVGELKNPGIEADTNHICSTDANFFFTDITESTPSEIRWYAKEDDGDPSNRGPLVKVSRTLTDGSIDKEFEYNALNSSDTVKTFIITRRAWDETKRCTDETSKTVKTCNIAATPERTLADANGCHPLTVNFTANATGYTEGATYIWDFDGDNNTDSGEENPTFVFQNFTGIVQTYTPSLTVTTAGGECSVTVTTDPIVVQPYIEANFAIDTNQGCSPFTQLVANNCIGGVNGYAWDKDGDGGYDDGISSNDWIFTGTNNTDVPTTVNIGLKVTTQNGFCSDTYQQPITINPTPSTMAKYTPLGDVNCSPLHIKLEGEVSGTATFYQWEEKVDNGPWVTIANTEDIDDYVIENTGALAVNHTFRFTVANSYGCSSTWTSGNIPVQPFVDAQFVIDTVACAPQSLEANIRLFAGASSYSLNWGDGVSSNYTGITPSTTLTHDYSNTTNAPLSYNVIFTVKNSSGCTVSKVQPINIYPEVTPNFTIDPVEGCAPLDVQFTNEVKYGDGTLLGNNASYTWNFGDGASAYDVSPSHTFINSTSNDITYNVELVSQSVNGCIDTVKQTVTARPYVQALFSIDTSSGCSPLNVSFSYNKFGGIRLYEFNWGDGSATQSIAAASATGLVDHQFVNNTNATVVYNVKYKVHSQFCLDSMIIPVTVYPSIVADFSSLTNSGCAPHTITFTNGSHYNDAASTPVSNSTYQWSFGDGSSSIEHSPEHTFNNLGTVDSVYSVNLLVVTNDGCLSQTSHDVTIHPFVQAHFAVDTSYGCSPLTVEFNYNTHPSITSYLWTWGDGSTENNTTVSSTVGTRSISHQFTNVSGAVKTFMVYLSISTANGCSHSMEIPIIVYPQITANFEPIDTLGCSPTTVAFRNNSIFTGTATALSNASYTWNFGDGSSSTLTNPTHTFENNGTTDPQIFTVTMQATSEFGCTNVATTEVKVRPFIDARFAIDTSAGCAPIDITFIYNTHPSITSYKWKWGDGTTSNGTVSGRITHRYTNRTDAVQVRYAKLIINNGMCSDSMEMPISVYPEIAAKIAPRDLFGCGPFDVSFTNGSFFAGTNPNTPLTGGVYTWDFGDGNSSIEASPAHTFDNFGAADQTYTVKLYAQSEFGCASVDSTTVTVHPFIDAQFAVDSSFGCSPLNISFTYNTHPSVTMYSWDWGDGNSETVTTPTGRITHQYINQTGALQIYVAKLTINNGQGCTDTKEIPISVYPEITAQFAMLDSADCNPFTVNFDNLSIFKTDSTELTNNDATYLWTFGDGSTSTQFEPTHTFINNTGSNAIYNVELVVTSNYLCIDRDTVAVTVFPAIAAQFAIDTSYGCSPLTIGFDYDVHPGVSHYIFDWNGDGSAVDTITTATGKVFHTYHNQTGAVLNLTPQLTVLNTNGCSNSVSMPISVYPEITANFEMADSADCASFKVNFDNTSFYSVNGTELTASEASYLWNFDDGTTSTEFEPTHTFQNNSGTAAVYNVELSVITQNGCTSTLTLPVTVHPFIEAQFAIDTSYGCSPLTIGFNYTVHSGISHYIFDWNGDGSEVDTITTPTGRILHVYHNQTGAVLNLTPQLTVLNNNGCSKSMSMPISVYPEITANFQMPDSSDCAPFTISFDNTSYYSSNNTELTSSEASYLWNFGDGTTSTDFEPTHTFQNTLGTAAVYNVELSVITSNGCTSTQTIPVTIHPYVEAQFAIDTSYGCSPLTIGFDYAVLQGNSHYIFDWSGDGSEVDTITTATGKILHTYHNQTGAVLNPTPQLTVLNVNGCSKSMSMPISVYPEITAAFVPSVDSGCNELQIDLANNSFFTETSNQLTNTRYYWNYGDGGSSELSDPSHIYINDDTQNDVVYTTRLLAISEYGCADSTTHDIKVFNRIESHFTFEYASHCTPFDVEFTSAARGASTYVWSYGGAPNLPNDTLFNDNTFTHQFTNLSPNDIAYYDVTLDVSNDEGCHSLETRTVEVYPIVDAQIVQSVPAGCSDLTVEFDNASTGGSLVSMWNFGNGQSASNSDGTSVSHTFTNRGSIDSVYTISLLVINPNGCRDSVTTVVTVYPKVESSFVFAQQSQCTPFYLDLTNTSLNGNTFNWDFGYAGLDTVVHSTQSFPYIFDNFTDNDILTYTITLATSDSRTGCSDTSAKQVTVYPRVVTRFDADVIEGCNPLAVNFTNTSTGLGTYLWEFGDGSTSNYQVPDEHIYSHVYNDRSVDFPVRLTTTNHFGCSSFKDTVITVYPLVEADFQWDKIEGCTPLTITLNNSSVSEQYSYLWDFGDNTDTTVAQPLQHTYVNGTSNLPQIETHNISLTVSYVKNSITCSDTMNRNITVFPHIYPDFTATFAGCHPHSEVFTNNTVAFNDNNVYEWNLGNGLYSMETNPALIYYNTSKTIDSVYTVKLVSTSVHGCVDSITHNVTVHPRPYAAMELVGDYISCPQFNVEIDNNSIGTNLTNIYSFGDGSDSITTSMDNITHLYSNSESETVPFVIQLNVETEFGCDDSITQSIYVYPAVTADYSVLPSYDGCSPLTVQFDSDLSNNAKFYLWNFDDGVTSSYSMPTHLFVNHEEDDKIFDVTLYASSEFGCFDIDTQQITVYSTPIVNFAVEPPLKQYPDATFEIHNQSSPAADSWSYFWDFGDSQYSDLKDPGTHTYLSWAPAENEYKYNITLRIENQHCSDTLTTSVFLLPAAPVAEFYSEIDSSCSPLEVNMINVSEYGESYFWDFGDGTTSTEMEPTHTFVEPGYYNVKLTVTGDGGSRFYYRTYRVYQNPDAGFVISPSHVMLPDATIRAFNLSKDYTRSLWDLGDGTISTDRDPVHTYDKLGEYKVSLWVYNDYGNDVCVDSISLNPAVWVEGEGIIKFPNAFKPNQAGPNGGVYDVVDYKNQVFHPYHYGITEYKLIIMSRWGEQLFTSDDVNIGWDGYVNGRLADQAVYVWRAVGRFTNEQPFDIKGTVTLIR